MCTAEVRGSLGMHQVEARDEWVLMRSLWEFLKIQSSCFTQIGKCLFHGLPLTRRSHFRALGDEDAIFFVNDCSKHMFSIPQALPLVTSYAAKKFLWIFSKSHSSSTSRNSSSHPLYSHG